VAVQQQIQIVSSSFSKNFNIGQHRHNPQVARPPSKHSLLRSVGVQIERRLHLASMARRTIDQWGSVFEAIDVSQEIKNNGVGHFRHVPGDLLGWFVVFFPLVWKVTVGTTHAERSAVTDLHNLQQLPRRDPSQDLDVLEHGFRRLVLLTGNLLREFSNLLVIELLDCFWGGGLDWGSRSFFLLAVRDSTSK
jgi:hypothetical protein